MPAASLKRRKHGLGLPVHIKKVSILLNIGYYIILPIYYLYILPMVFAHCHHPAEGPPEEQGAREAKSMQHQCNCFICVYIYIYIYIYAW